MLLTLTSVSSRSSAASSAEALAPVSVINVSYCVESIISRRVYKKLSFLRRDAGVSKLRTDFDLALSDHGTVGLPHDLVDENGLERVGEELISGKDILEIFC